MTGDPAKAPPRYIGVIGASEAEEDECTVAAAVGGALAESGAIVVCGGRGGVMEAACRGAREAGGLTVGILPGMERASANQYVDVALPTGLGELRNGLVVRCSEALVAVGGSWGTLSEIAFAMRTGRSVVALGSWEELPAEPRAGGASAGGEPSSTARGAALEPESRAAIGCLFRTSDAREAAQLALRLAAEHG